MTAPNPPKIHAQARRLFQQYANQPSLLSAGSAYSGLNSGFNSYLGGLYYMFLSLIEPGRLVWFLRNYDSDGFGSVAADSGLRYDLNSMGISYKVSIMVDDLTVTDCFKQNIVVGLDSVASPEIVFIVDGSQAALPAEAALCAEFAINTVKGRLI